MILSASCDGTGQISVDDAVSITVTHSSGNRRTHMIDFSFGCQGFISQLQPQELTSLFAMGSNTAEIRLFDICGGVVGCSSLFLFVEHGIVRPIPDPCGDASGHSDRRYEWRYELMQKTVSLRIPNDLICRALQARVPRSGGYPYAGLAEHVSWSRDDQFLVEAAQAINSGYTDYYEIATNTLHFVQGLMPYVIDVGDYWQLPVETLDRKQGDCEDGAVLYVSLLRALGYGDSVRFGVYPGHVFAFVEVTREWKEWAEGKPNKCVDLLKCWTIVQTPDGKLWAMAEPTIDPGVLSLGYWGLGCGCIPAHHWINGQVVMFSVEMDELFKSGTSLQQAAK